MSSKQKKEKTMSDKIYCASFLLSVFVLMCYESIGDILVNAYRNTGFIPFKIIGGLCCSSPIWLIVFLCVAIATILFIADFIDLILMQR